MRTSIDKIRVRFAQRRASINSSGKCGVACRIRVNGKKAREFATGLSIESIKWDSKSQQVKGATEAARECNRKLNAIRYEIEDIFQTQRSQGRVLSAQEVADVYNRKLSLVYPVSRLASSFVDELITKDRSPKTILRYKRCYRYLLEYLGDDLLASSVDKKHVSGFWRWLKQRDLKNDYCNKITQACFGLFRFGIREGHISTNPFEGMSLEWTSEVDITCLSLGEVAKLKSHAWSTKLQKVVDSFLFMCYTGLHICDYQELKPSDQYIINGSEWLKIKRVKTKVGASIPLHSYAKQIIDKYGGIENLPRISGQKSNDYLKLVAETVGIEKNLTNKMARKTFTDMALNEFNMSHESVAAMLGHTSTRQIKHYGSVNERRIFAEWKEKAL
ncbi:site-specific integrase [Dyadobacter sp. CY351]|uniref:site-specific integrase n=1 Tax=Dyadobacter sp. CY351 TaxID=2909337 RepID=UPI001F2ADBB8|nr:site-specific integrase [Dyadobacter sp. CY351]MCF2517147.1 site-specific integrase [Dyadobacter sp. CY351]